MEITLRRLLGLNVYSLDRGEKIGQVRNYLLNIKEKELMALLISDGKLRKEERILCLADVKGISPEAITVDSPETLRKKTNCPHLKDLIRSAPEVEGLSVLHKDGSFCGRAAAVNIDNETGKINRLELTNGSFFNQAIKGRRFINASDIEIIGNDVILIKDDATIQEEAPHHSISIKSRATQTEPGCGQRIRALSGKYPLPRRTKTVFPDISPTIPEKDASKEENNTANR